MDSAGTAPDYRGFLEGKIKLAGSEGFDVDPAQIHPWLKPHAAALTLWALRGGRRAIFANFGLHKTSMQLEWCRQIARRERGPTLDIVPLGVRHGFVKEAATLGMDIRFIQSPAEMVADCEHYITNYEPVRDGKLDPNAFVATALDEASVLRSYGSKTFQEFLPLFEAVPYKLVATATPSPNRYKELIHYAGFLGVMDTGQALTRFFQRDSEKAGNLTLYPHKEAEFWLWVHSWAAFLQKPSELGFSDEGYELPPIDVRWHEVPADHSTAQPERDGQGVMFKNAAIGVSQAAASKRDSLSARIAKVREIISDGRGSPSISADLLRAEQAGAAVETAPTKSPPLSCEQGRGEGEEPRLARSEPGEIPSTDGQASREKPGEDEGAERPVVSREQGSCARDIASDQAGPVWAHSGALRGDARTAAGRVRDLPRCAEGATGGSLPQHGSGQGAAVHEMQRRPRPLRGQPGPTHASSGLPDQVIVWCDLNAEQEGVEGVLCEDGISFASLYGSQSIDEREDLLETWLRQERSVFLSKPVMYGAGVNLQQCHTMIFAGIGFKFADFVQALHRIQRYGQSHPCVVHVIYSEDEREVRRTLETKWAQDAEMRQRMSEIIRQYGLAAVDTRASLARTIGVARAAVRGDRFAIANNDAVDEAQRAAPNSTDLVVTSIPFSNHYEYTASYNDFGHTDDNGHFWAQMDYLTPELRRILKPGRLACIHVKDRVLFGSVTGAGAPTISPFHAEAIFHYRRHGFDFMGMVTVVTDVVRENNQTYRLGYSEMCKDGTKMGVGSPEYIVLMRKPQSDRSKGYADGRVEKDKADYSLARWQVDAHAFWRSSGDRLLTAEELAGYGPDRLAKLFTEWSLGQVYDYERHVTIGEALQGRDALPSTFMSLAPGSHHPDVWHDVHRMLTLNGEQSQRNVEKHLCPLQFDIVDRLIERYSAKGEFVYDPFMGIGTVPYRAVKLGRRGGGSELSSAYFKDAVHYAQQAEREISVPSLFDLDAIGTDGRRRA